MKLDSITTLGKSEMNMTPMIDVVFQILIFFMVVTQFVNQTLEEVKLPNAPDAEEMVKTPPVVINVRLSRKATPGEEPGSEAEVLINRRLYSVAIGTNKPRPGETPLKEFLTAYVESLGGAEPEVQIRADARVHYRFVQSVVYIVSRCEIAKVSFATEREGDSG